MLSPGHLPLRLRGTVPAFSLGWPLLTSVLLDVPCALSWVIVCGVARSLSWSCAPSGGASGLVLSLCGRGSWVGSIVIVTGTDCWLGCSGGGGACWVGGLYR